jgi:hypothetical protein
MAPRLELEDVDGGAYSDVLDLWCGKEGLGDKSLDCIMAMASLADRLGMTEVGAALEEAMTGQLSVDVCGDVLIGSARLGLGRVQAAARGLALERFEEVLEAFRIKAAGRQRVGEAAWGECGRSSGRVWRAVGAIRGRWRAEASRPFGSYKCSG